MKKNICLLLLFVPIISLAKIKPKRIVITPQIVYEGLADKKIPMGEGKLVITGAKTSEYRKGECDVVAGVFNDTCVSNCVIKFANGLTYEGEMSYSLNAENIRYNLKKGVVKGEQSIDISGLEKRPFTCPINEPLFLTRSYSEELCFIPYVVYIPRKRTYTKADDFSKLEYVNFPLAALADFADNAETVDIYDCDILGLSWGTYKSGNNSAKIDFNNGIIGAFVNNDDHDYSLKITKSNGDSLCVFYETYFSEKNTVDIIHSVKNDFVEYHASNDYHGGSDLEASILCKLPSEIYNRYSTIRYSVKAEDRKKGTVHSDDNCFVVYYDGGSFYGRLYYYGESKYSTVPTELMIASMQKIPGKDDFYWGVYTAPDGSKTLYVEGHTLETLEAKYEEQERIRNEEHILAMQKLKKEEHEARLKELAKRKHLYDKYGKKYVDAIFDDHKILIGTPEGLIENNLNSSLKSENQTTRTYTITGILGTWAATVHVSRSTKRVTSVIYR